MKKKGDFLKNASEKVLGGGKSQRCVGEGTLLPWQFFERTNPLKEGEEADKGHSTSRSKRGGGGNITIKITRNKRNISKRRGGRKGRGGVLGGWQKPVNRGGANLSLSDLPVRMPKNFRERRRGP